MAPWTPWAPTTTSVPPVCSLSLYFFFVFFFCRCALAHPHHSFPPPRPRLYPGSAWAPPPLQRLGRLDRFGRRRRRRFVVCGLCLFVLLGFCRRAPAHLRHRFPPPQLQPSPGSAWAPPPLQRLGRLGRFGRRRRRRFTSLLYFFLPLSFFFRSAPAHSVTVSSRLGRGFSRCQYGPIHRSVLAAVGSCDTRGRTGLLFLLLFLSSFFLNRCAPFLFLCVRCSLHPPGPTVSS